MKGCIKGFHVLPSTVVICLHEKLVGHMIHLLALWLLHIILKTATKSWISTEYSHCQPRFMQMFTQPNVSSQYRIMIPARQIRYIH